MYTCLQVWTSMDKKFKKVAEGRGKTPQEHVDEMADEAKKIMELDGNRV